MPDWLLLELAQMQGALVRNLAGELRSGGVGALVLAFALGALHALTPGHGKAALAVYCLGSEARITKGVGIALFAALLHVASGLALFIVLALILGQVPSLSGRGSPWFAILGYVLIMIAGLIMLWHSLRPTPAEHGHDGAGTMTVGIGLLPCPLTISVLGFAWLQSTAGMVGLMLVALALGIGVTIGTVAIGAILGRYLLGATMSTWMPGFERWARTAQAVAGVAIVAVALYTLINAMR